MKRLKHIINWTIWSLLGLYFMLLVVIHLPAVQRFLGQQVAGAISSKLGTEVTVGRVDLGFFNRLIIDDVTIKDQQHQTMLRANRMSVKIELLPLLDGSVRISSAQLFGAHARFYKDNVNAKPNYQFVLDAFKSKEKKEPSKLDVRVNSIIIRNSSFRYDQKDAEETPNKLNTKHLYVSDISSYIQLKTLTNDSLNINVKRLTCREQSGLQINRFGMHLEAGRQEATVSDFLLQTPHSTINADVLRATYDMDHLSETISYDVNIDHTQICPSDFAPLLPALSAFKQQIDVSTSLSGTTRHIDLSKISLRADDSSFSLLASGGTKDDTWHTQIAHIGVTNSLIADLKQAIPNLPEVLLRLGDISLSGLVSRHNNGRIEAQGDIHTDLGQLKLQIDMDRDQHFDGHLDTEGLDLHRLLANDHFGQLAAQVDVSGTLKSVKADGFFPRFEYNDYSYQDIDLSATYEKGIIAGKLKINDPNIQTDLAGELHTEGRTAIQLAGEIQKLNPKNLNLSDRWGNATFSAIINADFRASSLNDAEGSFDIDDLIMTPNDSTSEAFLLDHLHVQSGYENQVHFVNLSGDFGEAELKGQFDWTTLPQSFVNYLAMRLPTLPGLPQQRQTTSNNFVMSMRIDDAQWLQRLFNIPLAFDNNMYLDAVVNDHLNTIDVNASLPPFTYQGDSYLGAEMAMTTQEDTTRCELFVTKLLNKGRQMELRLTALAGDNTIRSSLRFTNHDNSGDPSKTIDGAINTVTQLYTNEQNAPEAQVRVMPSHLMIQGTLWNLEPCDILYSDQRLMFDHFNLHHLDQHLTVDGVASPNAGDSLVIDLKDIDIAYVLDMVNFRSVRFGGLATGQAHLTEVLGGNFSATAELQVDDFTFMDGPMGKLDMNAYWNPDMKRIDLHALADAGDHAQTVISGYVSPSDKDIDIIIEAQGSPIQFCHAFTKSFFKEVKGNAWGELRVVGPLKEINLLGAMAVKGDASVTALGTTYALRGDTIFFGPEDISFRGFRIYDKYDHEGRVVGQINHRHLKHFTFDIDVHTDNLLAYDFPDFGQSTICGTVFATGKAEIHGRSGEVVINCDVTPERNSTFAYNAANPDAISRQQFITWNDRDNREVALLSPVDKKIPSDLRINFRINATPNATLRVLMNASSGDNITLQGNGVINASFYNKGPFQMFGTYNVERGSYTMTIQNILKKNFNFQEGGSIVFGGNPFDAALNLNAVYTVNGVSLSDLQLGNSFTNNTVRVNCLMNILGTAGAPRVEFDLEMPTVNAEEQQMIRSIIASEQELNQQVVYLLGIGRFYTQGANNAGSQEYGQTELAMQSFLSGTVSTQINEVLSQVIKNDDWNFGANISTGNEGWHNAEYEGLVSGRMLNNRLLINGQFGYRDNATQATPSFIGDFDIRYLLYPSGNLALKVYNQTNDRYFTRSSLNTQGVGLIMKKDFNGLGDLFRRKNKVGRVSQNRQK